MDEMDQRVSAVLPPPPDLTSWVSRTDRHAADLPFFHPRRILVVGLASPVAFSIAAAYPEAGVLAVDEDPASAVLAEVAAHDMRLTNLSLGTADLEDPGSLSGSFEWIHCSDPLRPTGNEESAWRTLAGHLVQDGFLTVRMRSLRQEYWADEFREALRILAGAEAAPDLHTWMALGHRLASSLRRSHSRLARVARRVEEERRRAPSLEAILALLPAGGAQTLESARALLAKAGLVLLGFLNQPEWDPGAMLADPELESLQEELSLEERYELADILRGPEYLLVCGHPPVPAEGHPR